ncbi:hypothetical protein CDAR_183571 [Caerostris darwini]|uniref:Uncharacterized protein n=1 Tax=Caerostris darwini TaxID=1538125 RepID=A0AAV4QVM9_9ARAC|nr:hypothetical protein CDAR_183571 [Caerostris darwini]
MLSHAITVSHRPPKKVKRNLPETKPRFKDESNLSGLTRSVTDLELRQIRPWEIFTFLRELWACLGFSHSLQLNGLGILVTLKQLTSCSAESLVSRKGLLADLCPEVSDFKCK